MKNQIPQHDYYRILGVPKSASVDDIKRAYRQLAQLHHPDRVGEGGQIVLINEAYAILKDPAKRAKYDVLHAVHFSVVGRAMNKASQELQKSPTVMANLQKFEIQAHKFARFAERQVQELQKDWQADKGIFKNAKTLFARVQTIIRHMDNPDVNTQTTQSTPTLIISHEIAQSGGTVVFRHGGRTIRTSLPQGLADGSQIKLTIGGVGVWFVIKVKP